MKIQDSNGSVMSARLIFSCKVLRLRIARERRDEYRACQIVEEMRATARVFRHIFGILVVMILLVATARGEMTNAAPRPPAVDRHGQNGDGTIHDTGGTPAPLPTGACGELVRAEVFVVTQALLKEREENAALRVALRNIARQVADEVSGKPEWRGDKGWQGWKTAHTIMLAEAREVGRLVGIIDAIAGEVLSVTNVVDLRSDQQSALSNQPRAQR